MFPNRGFDSILDALDKCRNLGKPSYDERYDFFWNLLDHQNKGIKLSLNERCDLFWHLIDTSNKGKVPPKSIRYVRACREIIKKHHEIMKDDPERLRSFFLVRLTGCNCTRNS